MEICGSWGVPIAMVPCLHQSNDYIKRKLRVWRAQKCNFLVGGKTVPTGTGLQTTPFHAAKYRADNRNLQNSCGLSPLYRVCTKAMTISKGSYEYGEPKNGIF